MTFFIPKKEINKERMRKKKGKIFLWLNCRKGEEEVKAEKGQPAIPEFTNSF